MATTANRGPEIEDLEVLLNGLNITPTVVNITFGESIGAPLIKGFLEMRDSAGLLDNVITTSDMIVINFTYHGTEIKTAFYLAGVEAVDLSNIAHEKSYRINLASMNELHNAQSTSSKAFNGSATDIIEELWFDHLRGEVDIISEAKNNGKYISPRMSPLACIATLLFKSYDLNDSPLFLYEVINNEWSADLYHGAKLMSWDDMIDQEPFTIPNLFNELSPIIPDEYDSATSRPGMPREIKIMNDHSNYIRNVNQGVEGEIIRTVNINTSSHEDREFNLNRSYYKNVDHDNPVGTKPEAYTPTITNYDFPDQKMCIGSTAEDNMSLSKCNSIRSKVNTVVIDALRCNAIPQLSPGDTINFKVPIGAIHGSGDEVLSTKYTGKYVVNGITHMIDVADKVYYQNIRITSAGIPSGVK